MKRFLAVAAGGLGVGALLRRRRRKAVDAQPDPAEELRTKLAESRTIVDEREVDEAGQTTVDQAPDPDPDARRKEVHARARERLDELG
jgi:hypothetical protein